MEILLIPDRTFLNCIPSNEIIGTYFAIELTLDTKGFRMQSAYFHTYLTALFGNLKKSYLDDFGRRGLAADV